MLSEHDFLQKINRKANEQKKKIRKRNRLMLSSAATLCLVVFAGILVFRLPAFNTGSSNKTQTSEEDIRSGQSQLGQPFFTDQKLITSNKQAQNENIEKPAAFFETSALLLFTAHKCPPQESCEIKITEKTITVTYPESAEKENHTPFRIEIPANTGNDIEICFRAAETLPSLP